MKRSRKLLAMLLAITLCLSNMVFIATADGEGAGTIAPGTEYTVTTANVGATNVNGQFAFKSIHRVAPVIAEADDPATDWDESDPQTVWNRWRASMISMPGNIEDMKDMVVKDSIYYISDYAETPSQNVSMDRVSVNSDGVLSTNISCRDFKVLQFTAPATGTYTLSVHVTQTWNGAAIYTSIGESILIHRTSTNVNNGGFDYSETVRLYEGEVYNIGITRTNGSYYAYTDKPHLTPFYDSVGFTGGVKVTYDSPEYNIFNFKDGFGDAEHLEKSPFSIGTRPYTNAADVLVPYGNVVKLSNNIKDGCHATPILFGYKSGNSYLNYSSTGNPNKLYWLPSGSTDAVIAFTAPECGRYSFDFDVSFVYPANAVRPDNPSRFYVAINSKTPIEGCDVSKYSNEATSFEKSGLALNKGDVIYFVYDPLTGSSHDSAFIDNLVVTVEEVGHNGEITWLSTADGVSHYQGYSCCGEATGAASPHEGGTATCTEAKVCTVCGLSYGEANGHTPSGEWICDGETHKMKCANCDVLTSPSASHVGNACGICGKFVYGIGDGSLTYNVVDNFGTANHSPWGLYLTTWNPDTNNLGERLAPASYVYGESNVFAGNAKTINAVFPNGAVKYQLIYEDYNETVKAGHIIWSTYGGFDSQIVFTAPDTGDYVIDFSLYRRYSGNVSNATMKLTGSRVYVLVGEEYLLNKTIVNENEAAELLNYSISLTAGQEVIFGIDPVFNGGEVWGTDGADEHILTRLNITYVDGCPHPEESLEWTNTEDTHYCYCAKCNTVLVAEEGHSGGTPTCTEQAVCGVCGQKYGSALGHADVNGKWTSTPEGHTFDRTCCDDTDITVVTPHDGDPCTVCGYEAPAVIVDPYIAEIVNNQTDIRVGQTVIVKVKVSGSSTGFAAGQFVIDFDEEKLTFNEGISNLCGYTANAVGGTLKVAGYGATLPMGTEFELVFNADAEGTADITLVSAAFSTDDRADTEDLITATVDNEADTVTVEIAPAEFDVTLPEILDADTTVAVGGESYTFYVTDRNYDYDITVYEDGNKLTEGVDYVDNRDGTYTILEVNGEITVEATRTAKTFDVTIPEKHQGTNASSATYGTDYNLTILPNVDADTEPGVIYTATVTIGGAPATFKSTNGNVYVIAGADITGDIVITVSEQAVPVNEYSVTVDGDTDGVTVPSATVSQGQTATLNIAPVEGYVYSVTAKVGGVDATVTVSGNVYTVSDVRGNVVFTVRMTVPVNNLTVSDDVYLELNGTALWLVLNDVDKLQSGVYTYGGQDMFWSDEYDAYCILVVGNKPSTLAELGINKNGTVTDVDYSGDVNKTGKIDANDAQLTYNMYNTATTYSDFSTVSMEKFLRADVNGDATVDVLDAAVIIGIAVNG